MKKYEVVMILDPQKVEAKGETFSTQFQAAMEALGAKASRVKCLDLKTFARPIGKHKAGIYWDYVVEAEGPFVAALKDKFRLESAILRLVVFEYEDGHDDDVFNPRPEHDALVRDDAFADAFEHDERPAHGDR